MISSREDNSFAIRAGYFNESDLKGSRKYFTLGSGFKFKSTRLDIRPNQLNDVRMVSTAFNEMLDNMQSATEELQNWSQQLEYKVQKKSEELSEMQNELIHIERIASLGKLSSSVAHEINNPLSGVLTYTKLVHKRIRKLDLNEEERISILRYLRKNGNDSVRLIGGEP